MSAEQVTLYAEFTAVPGAGDDVEALISEYGHAVRAEPGNVSFDVYRRAEDPDKFFVFEIYRNQVAFDEHLNADKGAAFNARLAPKIVEPESVLSFLMPIGGQ